MDFMLKPFLFACIATTSLLAALPVMADDSRELEIHEQPLSDSLKIVADEFGLDIAFFPETTDGLESTALAGSYTSEGAFDALLDDTELEYQALDNGTVVVRAKEQGVTVTLKRGGSDSKNSSARPTPILMAQNQTTPNPTTSSRSEAGGNEDYEKELRLSEIIVLGTTTNTDIRRYESDVQPYVVFNQAELETSAAPNIESFLKTRLPMNASQVSSSQQNRGSAVDGNRSSIDLRGLGAKQTLILVNGRRVASISIAGSRNGQPDINGIPMAAVERIEVLPSTASGIYGGSATGGVINIILRQDYQGVELKATYGNTFDNAMGDRRYDLSAGFDLNAGRTQVTLTGSYADSDALLVGSRDFSERARALQLANDPDSFFGQFFPPTGYTGNIRSISGKNLTLLDGTPLNSPNTYVPVGYRGPASDGGAALVENAGQYNIDLSNDLHGKQASLLTNPTIKSASVYIRQDVTDNIEAFADLSIRENQGSTNTASTTIATLLRPGSPNNPFNEFIAVSFPAPNVVFPQVSTSETRQASIGAIVRFFSSWSAQLNFDWTTSRLKTTTNIDVEAADFFRAIREDPEHTPLRDLNAFPFDYENFLLPLPTIEWGPYDNTLRSGSLRLSGSLYELAGGPITFSGLLERREENMDGSYFDRTDSSGSVTTTYQPPRSQDVDSVYAELLFPFVSSDNARRGLRALELQTSIRHDRYATDTAGTSGTVVPDRDAPLPNIPRSDTKLSSTDYTVGFRYAPSDDIVLRASFGTGFLPPALDELAPTDSSFPLTVIDPKRGGLPTTIDPISYRFAGNPDLRAEQSESISAGVILTPRFLPDLRLSVDYTSIKKTDEISSLGFQSIIDLEDELPAGRVTRAPLEANPSPGFTAGQITGVDVSLLNFATTDVRAIDIQANYEWKTDRFGDFSLFVVATRSNELARQVLRSSPVVDRVGFRDGPLEWRGNYGVTWDRGPWSLGLEGQYYDAYFVYTSTSSDASIATQGSIQGSDMIPSQSYHDVYARYSLDDSPWGASPILSGVSLFLRIDNVFDERPPIVAGSNAVGGYSNYGDPRMQRYTLSVSKSFQ